MPVKLTKTKAGKVRVTTPNGVKSKGTTPAKAEAQKRLLNAVEHGWTPGQSRVKRMVASVLIVGALALGIAGCTRSETPIFSTPVRFSSQRYELNSGIHGNRTVYVYTDLTTGSQYLAEPGVGITRIDTNPIHP